MKRLITCLLALTLCAGLMCAPAAAAEESAPSRLTPVQVWGTITRLDDDSILLENSNESNPNSEIIVHLSETTYLIDAVTGDPMKTEDLKDGDTVYAWVGPAMALSLPPQAAATQTTSAARPMARRAAWALRPKAMSPAWSPM